MDFRSFAIVATIAAVVFGCGCAANYLREYAANNAKIKNENTHEYIEIIENNNAIHAKDINVSQKNIKK